MRPCQGRVSGCAVEQTSESYKRAQQLKRAYRSSWYDLASRQAASDTAAAVCVVRRINWKTVGCVCVYTIL